MERYIQLLTDQQATLESVGGKGLSLARLANAGLPVPGAFFVTTDAYGQFVSHNRLDESIREAMQRADPEHPASLEQASQAIREAFARGQIPGELASAIVNAYGALPGSNPPVAVRSSATAEDLPEASFAGQQDTYLNVRGPDGVLEATRKCWSSLWTARAIGYRMRQGIGLEGVALAVVVQLLVEAEAAGIMFTVNPVNGAREELVINAAWGLGEAVVGGMVTPDTLTVRKIDALVMRRETAEKTVMTVRTPSGTDEQPVPQSMRSVPVLSDQQAARLARFGVEIEDLYAAPMDVEWTLADGAFAIVQARPITTIAQGTAEDASRQLEWPLPHPKAVLARGSFAEFVPEPVSPLFATLAVPIARQATIKLMSEIGVTDEKSYLFEVLNDYVYVGFIFTPMMMWKMVGATLALTRTLLKTAPERAEAARQKCVQVAEKWEQRDPHAMAASDLLAGAAEIFRATAESYTVAQSGAIPAAMLSEQTFTRFYNLLVKRKGDPDASKFLFGTENHALRAEKALFDLAMWVRTQPEVTALLDRIPAADLCRTLKSDPRLADFAQRLDEHLEAYGHAIYDLDFAKPVPAEDPAPLLETIKVYLSGRNDPYERQRSARALSQQAAESIARRLDPLRRKYFLKWMKWAQDTAPLREDSIAWLGIGYPQLHRLLAELGRRLAAKGAIASAEDVYWLELEEAQVLAGKVEKSEALSDHSEAIAGR
jgi:hypothetical protein